MCFPISGTQVKVRKPTWQNINQGYVVMIDGYRVGLSVAALASYLQDVQLLSFPQLDPRQAHFYTNAYRWAIRHISLIPEWFGSRNANYVTTHKVWRKRFFYLDHFVPQWMRKLLFFVQPESWAYEEWEWKKFLKYGEPHFSKYHIYPSPTFNDFESMKHPVTVENIDRTSNSIDVAKK